MAPKMGGVGQILMKCITGNLILMIRDKNNILKGSTIFIQMWYGIYPLSHYHHDHDLFCQYVAGSPSHLLLSSPNLRSSHSHSQVFWWYQSFWGWDRVVGDIDGNNATFITKDRCLLMLRAIMFTWFRLPRQWPALTCWHWQPHSWTQLKIFALGF